MPLSVTYFPFPGRAEATRLILTYGNIPFEDKHVDLADWEKVKPTTPFGQLPFLEHDGKRLAQSNAMELYCAKIAGLYPEDSWNAAVCQQWIDHMNELLEAYVECAKTTDLEVEKKAMAKVSETMGKAKLELFEKLLTNQQYILGDKLCFADLKLFHYLVFFISGYYPLPTDMLDSYPALKAYRNRIACLPPVKAMYANATDPLYVVYKPDTSS